MPSSKRLTGAFKDMRRMGLFAEENLACCQTCGFDEAARKIANAGNFGRPVPLGIVFYHAQDADSLDNYDDFYLSYSSADLKEPDKPLPAAEVARMVVAALRRRGIETEWNGDTSKRIKVLAASLWHDDGRYLRRLSVREARKERTRIAEKKLHRLS